jgi:capreomycidine synthase
MKLPQAELEHWMRDYYFDCQYDLGSSGVYSYGLGEIFDTLGLPTDVLKEIVFDDSLTRGSVGLRQALANRYGNGDHNNVMVANGSNEVLYHLLTTLLEPEDEVVVLDTIYHALDAVPIAKGCDIKLWKMSADDGFSVDLDQLREIVSTKTKLIAVNFPHNPTGVTITQAQQDELIEIARAADAYLVWDAAFDELTLTERLKNPFLSYDKAISVGTLSKCYGMPGLRVGWCFASEEVILKSVQLRDYTTLYVSPLIEFIAQRVIENADLFIQPRIREALENNRYLHDWIDDHQEYVEGTVYKGGATCLLRLKQVDDVAEFCKMLAQRESIMVVPGQCFGHKQHVRLGFGDRKEHFVKGLGILSQYLKAP